VLSPLERANPNYLSKGPTRVRVVFPLPEVGNSSIFRNVVFYSYLEFRTRTKTINPEILMVVHHHRNPLENTGYFYC
jgi:hypothetical protein